MNNKNILPRIKNITGELQIESLPFAINIDKEIVTLLNSFYKCDFFSSEKGGVQVVIDADVKGYSFDNYVIKAKDRSNVVYAMHSIIQFYLMHNTIPSQVEDWADYEWRGVSLDLARNYFTCKEVKRLIITYSAFKYNKITLHLTDDQGWRIPSKAFKELNTNKTYSFSEIKEIVDLSNMLGIDLIPEFDLPGHTSSLMSKVKGISCNDIEVNERSSAKKEFGVFDEVLCVSRENTRSVVKTIIDEIIELFNPKYLHIGGDECPMVAWEKCNYCTKYMNDKGYEVHDLKKEFTEDIIKYINTKDNIEIILWDDISESYIPENVIFVAWREWIFKDYKKEYLSKLLGNNNKVVYSSNDHTYFDYPNCEQDWPESGLWKGAVTTIDKVFEFDIDADMNHERIIGSQSLLWTERISTINKMIYNGFPRSIAMAEKLWNKKSIDKVNFVETLENSSSFYDLFISERFKITK